MGAAVVLADGAAETEADLQGFLQDRLSWARMPKRIVVLDEIPKGPTGKLQRIGLAEKLGLESVRKGPAEPGPFGSETGPRGTETPLGILERVAGLWKDVLKISDVAPDDPFLGVGGDSVTATMLVLRVEEEFSVAVPLMAFFDAATVRRQAELIDRLMRDPSPRAAE